MPWQRTVQRAGGGRDSRRPAVRERQCGHGGFGAVVTSDVRVGVTLRSPEVDAIDRRAATFRFR
jgi:hypothetical protein